MSSSMRFRLDSETFRENQDVSLDFHNETCRCTLNQDTSTPGLRLRAPVQLTKGDYELTVSAKASKSETFFLWVYDSDSSTKLVELYI